MKGLFKNCRGVISEKNNIVCVCFKKCKKSTFSKRECVVGVLLHYVFYFRGEKKSCVESGKWKPESYGYYYVFYFRREEALRGKWKVET